MYYKKSQNLKLKFYRAEINPQISASMLYIGQLYCNQDNEDKKKIGEEMLIQSLKILEDYFGDDNKITLLA